jgi:hypothetical protein
MCWVGKPACIRVGGAEYSHGCVLGILRGARRSSAEAVGAAHDAESQESSSLVISSTSEIAPFTACPPLFSR